MTRHQIAELVGASQLDLAAIHLVEVVEVVSLKHLVGELCQAHALRALQPGLHTVAAEHGAHPEVPTGFRQKPHHPPVFVPAQVIQHSYGSELLGAIVEVQFVVGENPLDAVPDALGVRLHSLRRQPLSLARFPARVPDLCRSPSEHRDHMVPGTSEVR